MALICGWWGSGRQPPDRQGLMLQLLDAQKTPAGFSTVTAQRSTGPSAVLGGVQSAGDGELAGVMDGEPRWPREELSELARREGPGVALLQAYRQFGIELPRHLRGSFALAVVDSARDRALLAVDRMGIRPLAYAATDGGGFVFGTSAEVVSRHPWVGQRIDPQAVFNYLFFHMVPSPRTIFAGVHKLGPAECVRLEGGRVHVERYWRPRFADGTRPDLAELAQEVRDKLRAAVAPYATGPAVAAFLSGGLDSSTVSGLLARLAPRRVATYTIGFAEQGFDEMRYARITAQHFATDAREYYVTPADVAQCLPRIAAAYDEPFGNSSAVPTLLCAQRARADGVERLLAGDGGDELFGGNERYARQKVFDFYFRLPGGLRRRALEPFAAKDSLAWLWPARKLRSYVQQACVPMPERLQTWNFMYRTSAAAVFNPVFLGQVDAREPLDLMAATYAEAPTESLVDRMLYLDWKITLADNDLRKVGRMCELAGVKVGYPMLDEAVIDASLKVPADQKVRGLNLRAFYKRTFRDFLPAEVIAKTKHGFGLPFGQWVKASAPLREEIYPSLQELKRREIVQPAFIDGLVREFETDPDASYYGPMIWVFSMLEHWLALRRL